MSNYVNEGEVPMGLGMALAQNLPAMNYFAALPYAQQQSIIQKCHGIQSKEEMQSFVASLVSNGGPQTRLL